MIRQMRRATFFLFLTFLFSAPPAPVYWMHQLGAEKAPRVNGPYFEAKLFTEKVAEVNSE